MYQPSSLWHFFIDLLARSKIFGIRAPGSGIRPGIRDPKSGSGIPDPNLESDTAKFFSHSHITSKLANVIINFLCLFSYKPLATKIGGAVPQKGFSSLLESFQFGVSMN